MPGCSAEELCQGISEDPGITGKQSLVNPTPEEVALDLEELRRMRLVDTMGDGIWDITRGGYSAVGALIGIVEVAQAEKEMKATLEVVRERMYTEKSRPEIVQDWILQSPFHLAASVGGLPLVSGILNWMLVRPEQFATTIESSEFATYRFGSSLAVTTLLAIISVIGFDRINNLANQNSGKRSAEYLSLLLEYS